MRNPFRALGVIAVSAAILLGICAGEFDPSQAKASCDGNGLEHVNCVSVEGPVGPMASAAIAGSEYVEDAVNCGPRQIALTPGPWVGNPICSNYELWCPLPPGAAVDPTKQIRVLRVFNSRTRRYLRTDVDCDFTVGPPMPSMAAIKAEATKRAPRPRTGAGGVDYLVNAAVVFYATPPAGTANLTEVQVPRFELGGHSFDLHLSLTRSSWTWGDGTTSDFAASTGHALGTPYSDGHPCESSTTCSAYISHVFRVAGRYTVSATAHWAGTYEVDGNPQQVPMTGELFTVDPAGRTVLVHEAHAELVAPS